MLKILHRQLNFLHRGLTKDSVKRFFLSNAYKCSEAWENRLKNPAFQKVEFETLYHQLDLNFQSKTRVSVLDVDLLANLASSFIYKNEVEDILWKLRLCPECAILPERATHAVIRWYMDLAPKEDLLNVLSDRLQYGLFPDYYLSSLLLDKYLKEKDAASAVKIATLQMLQEDFDHPIMKSLALHSCYNYLASPEIWPSVQEPEPDPDEEVQKVRVNFIKNPYFDNHFDIKDTNHLVGKTLLLIGESLDGAIGVSSQLVGLVLYEQYAKCAKFLEKVIESNSQVHADAITKAKEFTIKKPKQIEAEAKEEAPAAEENQENGDKNTKKLDKWKSQVLELLMKIEKKNLIEGDLLSETEKLAKKVIEENEAKDIELQCQTYQQWEKDREAHIQMEIKKSQDKKIMSDIQKTKEELEAEEQKIFYFDKEEEMELHVEEQEKKIESVVYYKSKKREESSVDEYIPPDVSERKN